jgi:hypothetical protein
LKRAILTIATGKKLYLDMAVNLARSFWLWNADSGIDFYLATDQPNDLPDDIKSFVKIIPIKPGELGEGFSPKLHLDKLAPTGQTLFVDSDCLIYGSLEAIFEKFKGRPVSVVGGYITSGEWFGDVSVVCKKFNIKQIPKFNGGIYYIENGIKATEVYDKARELEIIYDEIGFIRLRGRPNDEVLMALAMELTGQTPIRDDGSILAEFVNFQSGIESDILKGVAALYNDPVKANYQKNWHLTVARPAVVHFLGHHNLLMPYIKEVKLLEYICYKNLPAPVAKFYTALLVSMPAELLTLSKNIFRPIHHLFLGVRKIKKSERIID